jgi:rare lipoprotein A
MLSVMKRAIAITLLFTLVLAACAGKRPATQPPPSPDAAKLKPSQRPYTVLGKRYEPLPSHLGFVQEGTASWYGKDFHGKSTSSGEKYDMHAMTAAHKTLPLGVYVKVKNKDNGSEVTVKVNDRGPFVKNRVIDLSYAAAKMLGVDVAGTAPVRVEALGYRAAGSSGEVYYHAPENYDGGTYSVQVGAFKEYPNAVRLSDQLKKIFGYSQIKSAIVNGELYYRVHAGRYTSLTAAEDAEKNFAEHGYPSSFTVSLD